MPKYWQYELDHRCTRGLKNATLVPDGSIAECECGKLYIKLYRGFGNRPFWEKISKRKANKLKKRAI